MEQRRLVGLPPDLLHLVVDRLSSEQLGLLFCTGNTTLIQKLGARGVVSHLNPSWLHWHFFRARVPYLTTLELELEKITPKMSGSAAIAALRADQFPPTLDSLSVTSADDYWIRTPDGGFFSFAQLFPALVHLTVYMIDTSISEAHEGWMKNLPSSLRSINFHEAQIPLPPQIREVTVRGISKAWASMPLGPSSVFPAQLEVLRVMKYRPLDPASFVQFFSQLHTPSQLSNTKGSPFPNLHTLEIPSARNDADFFPLPASLTTLRYHISLNPSSNIKWPPGLTDMTLTAPPEKETLFDLPSSLTSLQVMFRPSPSIDSTGVLETLQKLPLGLQRLSLVNPPTLFFPYTTVHFPPGLHTLLASTFTIGYECAKALPPTLTKLSLGDMNFGTLACLPKDSLTWLTFGHLRLCARMLPLLPPKLTYLSTTVISPWEPVAGAPGGFFMSQPKRKWPPAEEWIDAYYKREQEVQERQAETGSSTTEEEQKRSSLMLPNNLQYLALYGAEQLGDAFFELLPNTITDLRIPMESAMTDEAIRSGLSRCKSLRSANLNSARLLTGSSFKYLPSSLEDLYLTCVSTVTDAQMADLPRGLLSLDLNAATLTDACVDGLPKRLEVLSIANSKISSKQALRLPKRSSFGKAD